MRGIRCLLVSAVCLCGSIAQAGLFDGLLVWHDFGGLSDQSANGHDVILNGNASLSEGLLRLDGVDDSADIGTPQGFGPVNPLVDARSDFTIALAYATRDDGSWSSGTSSVLASIGPDNAPGAADFALVTGSTEGQSIVFSDITFITSSQSGIGYANGSVHLLIVTYDADLDLFTFYHLDDTGRAISHGDSTVRAWDADWSEDWDENLDYGIRLGEVRNSTLETEEGMGDLAGQIDLFAIWDRALDVSEMELIPSYTPAPELAGNPSPPDRATDVLRKDTVLSWEEGVGADTHNVYIGTDFDDVNDANTDSPLLKSLRQDGTIYTFDELLNWGRTYYWRVDEVSGATVHKGQVWSFTAEPYLYALTLGDQVVDVSASSYDPNFDPGNTIDGSGLSANDLHAIYDPSNPDQEDNMWVTKRNASEPHWLLYEFDRSYVLQEIMIWNFNRDKEDRLGYGIEELLIEYSTKGMDFAAVDPVVTLAWTATGDEPVGPTTVVLDGVLASHVRLTPLRSFKNRRFGLSEVRLLYLPLQAFGPQPESGAEDVAPEVLLGWRAGRRAASHEVYLGTDRDSLALTDTVTSSNLAPPDLALGQTYYWQVNEVNHAEDPSTYAGDVWHFSTAPFVVVDDFEAYSDDNTNFEAIFQTWIDGFGYTEPVDQAGNNTGSIVGYAISPFAEQDIVHNNSAQSMPLEYDNTFSPFFSETTRSFDPPQDWAGAGIKALTLYVHGSQANTGGRFYVKVNNSPAQYVDDLDLAVEAWQEVNIDLTDLAGVNLRQVTSLTIGIDENGSLGLAYIDDIRLHPSRCISEKVTGDLNGDCLVDAADLAVITDNWLLGPLAAEYTFDNGLQDSSGNQRAGQGRNSPLVLNGVLILNGSNAMDIPLGADNPFDGSRDFSIALDFITDAPGLLLSSARDANPANHAMALFVDRSPGDPFWGEVVYENYEVDSTNAEDDDLFLNDEWHHVVVTYAAQHEQVTVYLNGAPGDAEGFNPAIPNIAADTVRVGSTLNEASPQVGDFVGDIDNLRIFNFSLAPDEIALLPRIPVFPGDVNQDGIVDQADKTIVESNMGPVQLWP